MKARLSFRGSRIRGKGASLKSSAFSDSLFGATVECLQRRRNTDEFPHGAGQHLPSNVALELPMLIESLIGERDADRIGYYEAAHDL